MEGRSSSAPGPPHMQLLSHVKYMQGFQGTGQKKAKFSMILKLNFWEYFEGPEDGEES